MSLDIFVLATCVISERFIVRSNRFRRILTDFYETQIHPVIHRKLSTRQNRATLIALMSVSDVFLARFTLCPSVRITCADAQHQNKWHNVFTMSGFTMQDLITKTSHRGLFSFFL